MDTATNRSADRPARRDLLALALWIIGALVWLFCLHAASGTALQLELTAAAIVLACIPPVRRPVSAWLDRIRNPSSAARFRGAVLIAIASCAIILSAAYFQAWDFILRSQDEHSYQIQVRMAAHGRLWMPGLSPDISDFFTCFAFFTRPTYGSMYFPGTAVMYAPSIWLHLPYWVFPLITAGICVGLTYRIIAELIDGVAGLLAAVMMTSLPTFRSLSLMLLSQTPVLLLGLLLVGAWLKWRKDRKPGWALAIGALAGWAMVTRPLDTLAYVVPIGIAMARDLLDAHAPVTAWARLTILAGIAASPFLGLELIQDRAMTGHWLESPNDAYAASNYPASIFGFHNIDWAHVPVPKLAEEREMMEHSFWPIYKWYRPANVPAAWWNERLPRTARVTLPNPLLATLIPVGLLGLTDRRRRVFAGIAGMFCLLYTLSVWYQAHYVLVMLPSALFITLLGIEQVRLRWPGLSAMVALIVVALSIGALAQTDPDNWSQWLDLVRIENRLATLPPDPAVVLFRYHPNNPAVNIAHHEPVYNTEALLPDQQLIVRAHDLGAQNIRLFRYYAATQPRRVIYLYDREGDTVTRLGTAAEAAATYNLALRSNDGR